MADHHYPRQKQSKTSRLYYYNHYITIIYNNLAFIWPIFNILYSIIVHVMIPKGVNTSNGLQFRTNKLTFYTALLYHSIPWLFAQYQLVHQWSYHPWLQTVVVETRNCLQNSWDLHLITTQGNNLYILVLNRMYMHLVTWS